MNGPHQHILVNHISLFAIIFGALALAGSMKRKSSELRVFAAFLFVLAGICGYVALETGEKAAAYFQTFGNDNMSFIQEHGMAAMWAFRSSLLIAVVALVMEWAAWKKQSWLKVLQWILLILAIHGSTVFIRTAHLGGLIGHPEIRTSSTEALS